MSKADRLRRRAEKAEGREEEKAINKAKRKAKREEWKSRPIEEKKARRKEVIAKILDIGGDALEILDDIRSGDIRELIKDLKEMTQGDDED